MNVKKLEIQLQNFKHFCQNEGYIKDGIAFEEISPKIKPAIFIVTMIANKEKIRSLGDYKKALNAFTKIFIQKVAVKTRNSIYMLVLKNAGFKGNTQLLVINLDLTSIKINKLYKNSSTRPVIRRYIAINKLSKLKIHRFFNTRNNKIIALLVKRYEKDETFKALILADAKLKSKIVRYII